MRKKSEQLFAEGQKVIPGGVNSPVRAFKGVGGTPVFFARGKGALVWDVDGNEYVDYVGSWGPLLLGHAHPEVHAAIVEAAQAEREAQPLAEEEGVAEEDSADDGAADDGGEPPDGEEHE